ncbi:poly [ADP-ribose] polymerase tankyrase-1-like [Rhopilema esculentum]|uniref:poly [ADP-ribose] polymerase tankyrase-1-like n=1 Tax=Rhopilema esculentum TaxID=499914 RepID=UPI0031D3E7F5|eukprot:gene5245-392_t
MAEEGLREAARKGDFESVKKLLLVGTKQVANEAGETPLFLATTSYVTEPKYVEVVRELLEDGADVNAANKAGDLPIHNAAAYGNFETTGLLIDYGADLEAEGEAKMVPLGLAAMKKHHAIVNLILTNLLENDKVSERQFKWMFDAADDYQQLNVYRALSSILQNKKIIPKLVGLNIFQAICKGFKSKKSVVSTALKLLLEILKTPEGVKAAKENGIEATVKETIAQNTGDAVLEHLGSQVLEKLK